MSQWLHNPKTGTLAEYADADVAAAIKADKLVPATQEQVSVALEKDAKRQQADTAAGKVAAFGEGLTSGTVDAMTAIPRVASQLGQQLGVTDEDVLGDMTGRGALETTAYAAGGGGLQGARAAQKYAEEARIRAEENKVSSTLGTIAGQVVGSEIGGLGALARGAGGLVSKGLGAGRFARVAGAGVTGAAEGAPLGLVAAQDEAYIQNRKLTGGMALAAMGMGGLMGAGIGVGARGLGESLGYAKEAIAGRTAARRAATEGLGEVGTAAATDDATALQRILRTSDADLNKVATDTLGEAPKPRFAESLREAVSGKNPSAVRAAKYAGATDDLTSNLSNVVKASNEIGDEVFVKAAKRAHVEANLAKSGIDAGEAISSTRRLATDIGDDITAALEEGADSKVLRGLRKQVAKQEQIIANADRAEDAYMAMDQIRRDLHQSAKSFGKTAQRVGDVDAMAAAESLNKRLGEHYDQAWAFLMDEPTWGAQGAAQKQINQAAVDFIEAKRFAFGHFADEVGEAYQGAGKFRPKYEVNDGKVAGLVRRFGTPDGAFAERRFNQYMQSAENFANAVGEGVELPAEKLSALKALRESTTAARKTFGEVAETAGAMNQVENFLQHTREGSGALGTSIVGGVVGGPVGAALGAATGAALNPAKFITQRLALEQMASKAERVIGGSLDNVFANIERSAGKTVRAAAPEAYPKATATAIELFRGKFATPEMAYRERAKEVMAANENMGQRIRDNAGEVFGSVSNMDPHSVGAAVVAATKGIQLLMEKMPVGLQNPQSYTPLTSKPVPSRAEIMQFADLWTAVTKPLAVIGDMSKGTVSRDQIDAIRQVHPEVYNYVREQTFSRLMKLDRKGIEVPIRERLILDSLLDLDGAGEVVFSSKFAEKYGPAMTDEAAAASEGPRPAPTQAHMGERLATGTNEMIGGEL